MQTESLGMIEVTGYLGLIAAADAVLKAADVHLLQVEKISGGLSTLQITGDVGAVQAAIQAGENTARNLKCLISSHVIPRVDSSVILMETKKTVYDNDSKLEIAETKIEISKQSVESKK